MILKNLTFIILISISYSITAQKAFAYTKWKQKDMFPKQKIDLVFLTSDSAGKVLFQSMGERIMSRLHQEDIGGNIYFRDAEDDTLTQNDHLSIVFSYIEPAHVKLDVFGNKIPLCNRIFMRQTNNFPRKKKYRISTIIAVSVDKEAEAIEPMTKSISERLYLQFVK